MDDLKQALKAILIGVAVTLITQVAQALISWLQGLDASAIGSAVAATRYALAHAVRHA